MKVEIESPCGFKKGNIKVIPGGVIQVDEMSMLAPRIVML
jgi:hypothetical protein